MKDTSSKIQPKLQNHVYDDPKAQTQCKGNLQRVNTDNPG